MDSLEFNNDQEDPLSVVDAIDCAILMHRDVHFGGNFSIMIHYYHNKGKGCCQDFELKRIYELAELEKQLDKDIAPLILTGAEAEHVARAIKSYKDLRSLYEKTDKTIPKNRYPILIANLILSEEEEPLEAIQAIVDEKEKIVPELLALIRSDDFHNPIFPGFGLAPIYAAQCLGKIGDKRAIIAIFETIGHESDFFNENIALDALKLIGQPAKEFLLHVVNGKPYNEDNDHAAIALSGFKEDPAVATACFNILKNLNFKEEPIFASYLILNCEGLKDTPHCEAFLALANDPQTPKDIQRDILTISKEWANTNNVQ